jgi:hypothetical protein
VNKHPQNSLRLGYLKAIFPDALFIHVIRDGRAVVHSTLVKWRVERFRQRYPFGLFPKPPAWREYRELPLLAQFAHQWQDIVAYVRNSADCFSTSDAYLEVTYEGLCSAPHETFRKVDLFLRLDPEGRDYHAIPHHLTARNRGWKSGLDSTQVALVESMVSDTLLELGYA